MKRTKFIALALVVAIMLMGAGYAAWTDEFHAISTVDTGKLEVEYVEHSVGSYVKVKDPVEDWKWYDDKGTNPYGMELSSGYDSNTDTVTFTYTDLFPGIDAFGDFKLKNSGTIPATIQKVKIKIPKNKQNKQLYNALEVNARFYIMDKNGDTVKTIYASDKDGNGTSDDFVSLDKFKEVINKNLKGVVLQPEDMIVAVTDGVDGQGSLCFRLDENSLKGDQGEEQAVTITLDFDFVQGNLYDPTK